MGAFAHKAPPSYRDDLASVASERLVRQLLSWDPARGSSLAGWVWYGLLSAMRNEMNRMYGWTNRPDEPLRGYRGWVSRESPGSTSLADEGDPRLALRERPPEDLVVDRLLLAEVRQALVEAGCGASWSDLVALELEEVQLQVLADQHCISRYQLARRNRRARALALAAISGPVRIWADGLG